MTILAGTGAAQVIVLASAPILTRIYSPAEYGAFSVAVALLGVLVSVACLRYEYVIPVASDDVAAANVLALALTVNAAMALATLLLIALLGPSLLSTIGSSALGPYLGLFVLAQMGGGMLSALTYWEVRTKDFRQIAASRVVQSASLVTVQVGLGVLAALGTASLLLGVVFGSVAGSAHLAKAVWRDHLPALRGVSRRAMLAAGTRYRRHAFVSTPAALIANIGLRVPVILLVALYGAQVGGQYALAERICYVPLTLIGGAVGQVYVAESAQIISQRSAGLRALFVQTTAALFRVSIGPALLLAVVAPFLAGPVFGNDWSQAGLFVTLLVPMYVLAFVLSSTGDIIFVLERQGLFLLRELIRLSLLAGSVLVAGSQDLPPVAGIALLSAAGCVTYLLYGLISWLAVNQHSSDPAERHGSSSPRTL